jgi:RHS repeat-associated protein
MPGEALMEDATGRGDQGLKYFREQHWREVEQRAQDPEAFPEFTHLPVSALYIFVPVPSGPQPAPEYVHVPAPQLGRDEDALAYHGAISDRAARHSRASSTTGKGGVSRKVASSVTHSYVYDGQNIIEERLSSGQTNDYVHAPGTDRPLAQRDQAGTVSYYLADHLGSIAQMTSSAGAVTLTREYDPWGNLLQGGATVGSAFTGREWDSEVGLYYYRARYYDPGLARFISKDPIGLAGGGNFYRYVRNAPTVRTDPSGLSDLEYDRCLKNCLNAAFPPALPSYLLAMPIGLVGGFGGAHAVYVVSGSVFADAAFLVGMGVVGFGVLTAGFMAGSGVYCAVQCKIDKCFVYPQFW